MTEGKSTIPGLHPESCMGSMAGQVYMFRVGCFQDRTWHMRTRWMAPLPPELSECTMGPTAAAHVAADAGNEDGSDSPSEGGELRGRHWRPHYKAGIGPH